MGSGTTSAMQRIPAAILAQLYGASEQVIVLVAILVGVLLAIGLYSPSQSLAIAAAGTSVYFAAIVIDPLKGMVLWLATQPLLRRYLNFSLGEGIPDLSFSRLCLALITVLLLARTATRRRELQPITKFDALVFLFMIAMMQAGSRGLNGMRSMQDVFDLYWIPALTYFAIKNLVTSRRAVHLVLWAVLIVAVYSAIYAFYESTTGQVLFVSKEFERYFYGDSGLRVLRGIWGSNVGFGRVFNMAIPILFYFYLKAPSPSRKMLFTVLLALVFGGMYITYKRTAWIAMVAVLFVMQLFYPQFRRLFILILIVVSIASALNWDRISTSTVYTDRVNSQKSTQEDRTSGWEHALEFWRRSPLLGHGYQQYRNLARSARYKDQAVESEYFEILVSSGLSGFLPYIGLLLLMAYHGYQHYRGRIARSLADRDLVAVFWGILTGYTITIATSTVGELIISSMLFAVAGAIIYARRSSPSELELHP